MTKDDKKILGLMREQYESHLYKVLLEIEVKSSKGAIQLGAGLTVKNKKGEKFTVHSITGAGDDLQINLISAQNTKLEPGVVPDGSPPDPNDAVTAVNLKTFEKDFEEA